MRRWLPVIVASGVSLGIVLAYLIGGGASYQPLPVADPCQPRSEEILAERGVFEGILLSGLDGAACELGVSREELATALGDETTLDEFAAANGIDRARIEDAVRAGLIRAIDDAEMQGRLPTAVASIARGLAENAPVGVVIDLFEALPGDPTLAEVVEAIGDAGLTIEDLGDAAAAEFGDFLEGIGAGDIGDLLPEIGSGDGLEGLLPPELSPENLPDGLVPEGVDPEQLQDELEGLLP
jgi:hypothetical protein